MKVELWIAVVPPLTVFCVSLHALFPARPPASAKPVEDDAEPGHWPKIPLRECEKEPARSDEWERGEGSPFRGIPSGARSRGRRPQRPNSGPLLSWLFGGDE